MSTPQQEESVVAVVWPDASSSFFLFNRVVLLMSFFDKEEYSIKYSSMLFLKEYYEVYFFITILP